MTLQILLPLDGSPFSEQVLSFAGGLTRRSDVVLHLVQVHRTVRPFSSRSPVSVTYDWERRISDQAYLGRIAEWFRAEFSCAVRSAVLQGGVVSALNNYIRDNDIGLVVMTTHGHGGLKRTWLGSVADGVVRTSPAPVLLMRPQLNGAVLQNSADIGRILIPLDGSALSEQIIEPALTLGTMLGAKYRLVQIVSPARVVPSLNTLSESTPSGADGERARLRATQYLEQLALDLTARGHDVDVAVITHWHAAAAILDASAHDSDLIAMATHGRGGWQRVALGSVTEKVQRNTTLPMLMLQPAVHIDRRMSTLTRAVGA